MCTATMRVKQRKVYIVNGVDGTQPAFSSAAAVGMFLSFEAGSRSYLPVELITCSQARAPSLCVYANRTDLPAGQENYVQSAQLTSR